MAQNLVKIFGTVCRVVGDTLTFVELEPNAAGKKTGLLFFNNCDQFPEANGDTRNFRIDDKVEGYIDPEGTDAILKARVTDPQRYASNGNEMSPATPTNKRTPLIGRN